MAYFDEKQSQIILDDDDKDIFNECKQFVSMPKEKRPKPELCKWLDNLTLNNLS